MSKKQTQLKKKAAEILRTGNLLMAVKFVKDNSDLSLFEAKEFCEKIRTEIGLSKQSYIIVGDDNYWYATATDVTKEELSKIVKDTIEMIYNGGSFTPTPASTPETLYAYPVGKGTSIDFAV